MFEAHVLHLLRRYLGEYVHGLSPEALRICVWKGDVVLKDLKLKAEALNALNLPITVKAGFLGSITLKVPWKSLGKEPVIVLIDRVFVLAHPAPDGRSLKEEDREKLFEAKIQQIEEAESATIEAMSRSKPGSSPPGNSWLGSLIATIIGNLKISISNVHIRYEDCISNPGHPFASGVTLAKLAAVTMDEQGNETFDTSGALDKLRKSLQLERLAMYHDSDSLPWNMDKKWEDLSPKEWIEVFGDGINEPAADCEVVSKWAMNRNYLVSPINGVLKYHRLGNQERNDPDIPFEKASLVLSDVSLTITEAQYHDSIKLLEAISRYRAYVEISHLRPVVPVSKKSCFLWWHYAAQATLLQRKMCYRFSWDQIQHMCHLRRRYIHLYASLLQQSSNVDTSEIRGIEKDLGSKVILLWRLLAHAKVESAKSKEAAKRKRLQKKSWFSLKWGTQSEDTLDGDALAGSQLTEESLSKEEWQAINNLLNYQPDKELMSHSGKDIQNMIRILVTVSISQATARIINSNQMDVVCGRFGQLHVSAKFKHCSTHCDVKLKFYGLSAPEGSLAQSVCSEQKENALSASFVHLPIGENVDWRLSATISPCHVTILKESCDRFFEFVKRSNAVSPTVALETATALQTKIEKVTRRAQEQFQTVLKQQSRFALDIDFDAPKVRIPLRTCGSSKCDSHFLLDFGHFTLNTVDSQSDVQRQNLYSRFYISGRDIAASLTECGSDCQNCSLVKPNFNNQSDEISPVLEKVDHFYSLIDRCGIAVVVEQIKVPHPSYPSTLVSVQVPNLGIHFSPARFCRLKELVNILYVAMDPCVQPGVVDFQAGSSPWSAEDLASDAKILVWRGIGNSVASWQPCFVVLSGFYLYILESEKSQNHQRYLSMVGRQVYEVPSTNVGGSSFCVAVSSRGMDTQKALESSGTWVIEFRGEDEKVTWLRRLVQATYQASAPPSVDLLGETSDRLSELDDPQMGNSKAADLVINGAVLETKLFIYGKTGEGVARILEEQLIVEVLGSGGKVKVISRGGDLVVKTKLHSLKIKDELQGCLSGNLQYLACSVLKNDNSIESHQSCYPHGNEISAVLPDDDDTFTDAMPEFMSLADSDAFSHMKDASGLESAEVLVHENDLVQENRLSGEIFYETEVGDEDFVSVTLSKRGSGSLVYDGIDTQMSIRMSKLEFFCNRPTLVALIGFGIDLGSVSHAENVEDLNGALDDKSLMIKEKAEESGRIEGLLGYGKARVVFYLNMNVDSVTVFLNMEDGSQLAMFVQESFLLDLKIYPASLSIEGTLGNLKLRDMSLGIDNYLGLLCDIRNPGDESLIKFKFSSYSAGDDDYEGYDHSLFGRLSAVRIVFLYRFIQEITVYFMELATPHTEEVIKLVDKVGDFEWLIQKSEIDGASALKLDLTLDTPIIIVPRNSISKDFIQLDVGLLKITNEISWHGFPEKDPSAVHLDILHVEILGVNMSVGIDGYIGKPLIREGRGLDIYVRRSLRDVFKKVPTFALDVKVGYLHAVMSDKEYDVILNCALMNLNETPRLPQSFRGSKSDSVDTMRQLVDKVNMNSQMLLSRSVTIVAVEVNYALLELCNGIYEESPLAQIALEGLWVSYRMTSLSEKDLYVTIPTFSILDIRTNTKPEMRLMLGSSVDACKQASNGNFPFFNTSNTSRVNSEAALNLDVLPISTMLLMDCRWRLSSQSFVLRVQHPRVLVVPDFLLALGEFFVPALGTITGREETTDPRNDPISKNNSIMLSDTIYKQSEDVVHLSPSRQLIADTHGIDDYTYDGCGKTIFLADEKDMKETYSASFRPILIIGRGKRLRFVNVKIENGFLLRKYVYLSNDSSYSVSPEDDVDIILMDNSSSEDDKKIVESMEFKHSPKTSSCLQDDQNVLQSLTFEAQVVSPEFTFFDGSKSYLDDSSYGEKLLRAKLDLNFMYALKENDTWIRAMVKDLTIEAGSGLIILDPLDISGGYTSTKEKTNLSLILTDICIHLSLSAISLLLNLLNQVAAALQFRNAIPLAPCTNFDRIWVSPKENGSHYNLTIWRPQAPSNYVILGDCVTSRPIPPSHVVLAVSNTYGRVRKAVGFNFIGFFSHALGLEGMDGHSDVDTVCSLWMPVPPPGYTSMGCVANIGKHPPPNHAIYCLRSDLVTSTTYSECMLTAPSNQYFTSGFSIWRLDNVLGSFYAHSSTKCPSKEYSSDLSHLLLWNSVCSYAFLKESVPRLAMGNDHAGQQTSNKNARSSGWEVSRSNSKATSCYMSTPHFERMWWDKGCDLRKPVSIWRPIPRRGYAVVGDCITEGLEPPALGVIFKSDDPEVSAKPVQFTKVAHITGKGFDEVFFWYPIPPPGYASLGCVVSRTDEVPSVDIFCCPRMDLVNPSNILEVPISRSSSSKASQCWSIWKVENQASTFLARSDMIMPSPRLAYNIGDSVKPRMRENVTAEIKLRYLSLTVLDSLHGMMTPLFDMTITNIKLATHGRLEAMNAVFISSIAASAFNTQLEAWEPLVEPFDGIFKFETYDTNVHASSRLGKRMRIAATNIVNINVSAANLDTLVETILSWRRQLELEQKATKLVEDAGGHSGCEDLAFSALDEEDLQTVIVENQLGNDLMLRRIEKNSEVVDQLHNGDSASVWIPPARFLDRLNVAEESREARYYVSVQIHAAKDLSIIDDGNSHNFFCALRLVIDSQATDQQKLFPQSARTKCVKPLISETEYPNKGNAKWNELFVFEVPRKGVAKLEVEVTNLSAKAGKGEVVGALSFPVGYGANILKKVSSARMLSQRNDVENIESYPLRRKFNNVEDMHDYGHLLVSTSYFERNTTVTFQSDAESTDNDIGFWVRLGTDGSWESVRSLLPLSIVPKSLQSEFIAMEVIMKNGKKHAIFRGLATVVNDSDVNLDISVCHVSVIHDLGSSSHNMVVEEIFENQCYHPITGWGSKWSGLRGNNPGRWSTKDFTYSSKEFFEPPLPNGWQWISTWTIDKPQFVDEDGWAYGPDYQSLKWPPTSSKSLIKSGHDVRRRRWIRTRQQILQHRKSSPKNDITTISPGCSSVLPWRSTSKDSDQCLRVRPCADHPQPLYYWGQTIVGAIGPSFASGKDQPFLDQGSLYRPNTSPEARTMPNCAFKLNELEKKDVLLCCCPSVGSRQIWLSVGADASALHTELNHPVYDWKISINSPLKLENRLSCPAKFTIWEKAKEGKYIEREKGIISSRKSAHIYSVDIQRPIYLTFFVQGGWVLEKDPVLILDLSSDAHISSFWMFNQKSKRRLRVSIECDMGGTSAAPKTIRFFVPYWIINDSSLPLEYQVVEIEGSDVADMDSHSLSRAVKSARTVLRTSSHGSERRHSCPRRNIQVLEAIEDTSPVASMLSPLDSAGRSGVMLFPSQKDTYVSPRVGIAVAIRNSEIYSPGISLLELEKKERVDVKAFDSDGSYYKLSALVNMTSDRTKVIHLQPHTLFINRVGFSICLQQCDSQKVKWIHPTDPPQLIGWQSFSEAERLKLRVDGYNWSTPFSVSTEGLMRVSLRNDNGSDHLHFKVEVRSGTKSSRYEIIFRPNSSSSPYRIENHSNFLPIRCRQVDGNSDSWLFLLPNTAISFLWEDLGRRHMLEVLGDGTDPSRSENYNIDEIFDHQPIDVNGPTKPLRVTILKEERVNVVKISDWMPENEPRVILDPRIPSPLSEFSGNESELQQLQSTSESEFHVVFELAEIGMSIIDHTPEEILYLSVQNLHLAYSTGLGSGFRRIKLRLRGIQIDNQLPLTPTPVLFRPQRIGKEDDYVLKSSVTMQTDGSLDLCVYPHIGFSGPDNCAFLINIHEPIIWRIHEMIQQIDLSRLYDTKSTAVSVDPIIQIGVLNISEIRLKVSMSMSPSQRPRGVLGFWSSLMTALGNTENMTVKINQRFHENVCMRQSTMISNAIANIKKDVLGQPLQLLSGLDILGNASSALGHMSKGVAALSMDKKFIQSRQRQESKGVEVFGDVIREGGGALAKGLFRGVTGILTKPLEGAKTSGVEGFVQGVGKGIIGAAAQPVSGVLDLLSKTTEGANAMRMKIAAAITSDEQLLRRRLPRVIGGDNLLRPYDEYKAQGQVMLQLAESGSFFLQVDLFKVRGKFALSDAYEDHFMLPKGKIVMITHRRVLLLQQLSHITQRRFNPARDPCSVLWEVMWHDLGAMELSHGKKDPMQASPSRLLLFLHTKPTDTKEQVRVIKCSKETPQVFQVYSSIQQAMNTYGEKVPKELLKKKVTKPYSPVTDDTAKEALGLGWQMPPMRSTFGTATN